MDENNIRLDYRRYVPVKDGPQPSISHNDYSIMPVSQIGIKFRQFLNADINELKISIDDANKVREYIKTEEVSLENLLAGSFIAHHAGTKIDKPSIYNRLENQSEFMEKYIKDLVTSKMKYEKINTRPSINNKTIEYNFLNFL
jgi:hypothetical protein